MHTNYILGKVTRGHGLKLYQQRSRLNLRKENVSTRIINIWNYLPAIVVMSPSVNTFKNRLDKHWSTKHFLYDYGLFSKDGLHLNKRGAAVLGKGFLRALGDGIGQLSLN